MSTHYNIGLRLMSLMLLAVAITFTATASATDIVVKASLDSATLEMGRQTALHVEIFGTINAADSSATEVILNIPDSIKQSIEVAHITPAEVTDLGGGRARILRDIIIQGFDSGVYTLPPVLYLGPDSSFPSNETVIKVYPIPVDSLKSIHDYADVVSPNRQLLDYLPDWMARYGLWIILVLALLAGATYIYIRKRRGVPVIPATPVKKESPVTVALRQLNVLREENLCQRGEEKQYYTRLTDILRVYLHDRFGINAMEMTSTQIRHALNSNDDTRLSSSLMGRILEMADFVKFAKVRPLPDDNTAAMTHAVKFINDTRPLLQPTSPDQQSSTDKTPKEQ
ncbi:MAG: hypothetical protein NC342_03940 [Pseudoflavonifractor sp.]|nr:hypothetical protein [Alloprevotella sp.]MCM1116666.1 hypothetical protein [Pseudoflavonifractor sp.]